MKPLSVSFYVKGGMTVWEDFANRIGMEQRDENIEQGYSFVALPTNFSKGSIYLAGGLHPSKKDDPSDLVHWHLDWVKMPSDDPPTHLRERSAKVGGFPGILGRILDLWPTGDALIDAQFFVNLDPKKGTSLKSGLTTERRKVAVTETVTLTEKMRVSVWVPYPKLGIVEEITLASTGDGRVAILSAEGHTSVHLSVDMHSKLEGEVWKSIAPILQ